MNIIPLTFHPQFKDSLQGIFKIKIKIMKKLSHVRFVKPSKGVSLYKIEVKYPLSLQM